LMHISLSVVASLIILHFSGATKKGTEKQTISEGQRPVQCGTWTKYAEGGIFTSPNYPNKYPPDRECVYIIEVPTRGTVYVIYDVIPPWLSPRCMSQGVQPARTVYPTLKALWCEYKYVYESLRSFLAACIHSVIYLLSNRANSNTIPNPDFKDLGVLKPLPVCEFEMGGPEGIVESVQIVKEGKASETEAVDCKWYIRAPPRSKIYLRFLDYEMQNSNECKRNFVAVYDGSSSVEDLKAKFCSTVANDVMLRTGLGVIRMWADEGSRNSRFQMLFTSFQEPPCEANTFFCHSNMCINNTLVCNGLQNCVYPWDENHCTEKRKANLLDQLTNTSGTIIGVTSCIVIILIVISIIVQIKQPRKKFVPRKTDFDQTVFQEVFEPPHYELCTLRGTGTTADLADVADDFENYHKLRRSSSKCIHDHHCGSQVSSIKGSRSNLSTRDASVLTEIQPQPVKPLVQPMNRRNILVMKHSYSQDAADACEIDEIEEVPTTSHRLSRHDKAVQR
ncbi:NETO1 protein, partial [Pteruthius melanotis]|nr:NETO1 protein [Pteruthius melanotis]